MRENLSIVPHCRLDEVEDGVARHLAASGWQRLAMTQHGGPDALTAAIKSLDDAPGARMIIAYDHFPAGVDAPITVLRGFADDRSPWDPVLLRTLSDITGGWAYGMLADRGRLEFAHAAFYAGHTLEAEFAGADDERFGWAPPAAGQNEASTRATWGRLHTWIARTDPHDLFVVGDGPVACWTGAPPEAPPFELDALVTPRLVRAVFPATTATQLRAALAMRSGAALNIVERATTLMQTPYVLADGWLPHDDFVAVARALGGLAVRLELGGSTGAFDWVQVAAAEVSEGRGHGALPLAAVLGAVAHTLGEPVSAIR